jgi:ArsR family transcriptional regulator, arsenate/arsenite/antimonite-responsive transcriptional repressor
MSDETATVRLNAAAASFPEAEPCPAQSELPPEPRLNLPAPEVTEAVAAAALVADRSRAAILRMLADGPHCVCEIAAALDERQNNVSMHLARLREAGLVRAVRHSGDARWIFYERDEKRCAAVLATLTDLLG